VGREPEDVSSDDFPAIVVLIQLIYLIVCQVVSCKVIAQYPHLWGKGGMMWDGECVHAQCLYVQCAVRVFFCMMKVFFEINIG